MDELKRFPRLDFLEHALDGYFKQIRKSQRLDVHRRIDGYERNISVGEYLMKLALLRRERKNADEESSEDESADESEHESADESEHDDSEYIRRYKYISSSKDDIYFSEKRLCA